MLEGGPSSEDKAHSTHKVEGSTVDLSMVSSTKNVKDVSVTQATCGAPYWIGAAPAPAWAMVVAVSMGKVALLGIKADEQNDIQLEMGICMAAQLGRGNEKCDCGRASSFRWVS